MFVIKSVDLFLPGHGTDPVERDKIIRFVPEPLEAVLMRAMESDPARRYGSAREFGMAVIEASPSSQAGRLREALDQS